MKGFYELFNSKALQILLFSPLKLHGQTVIQTYRQTRQINSHTDVLTDRPDKHTDRQSYRRTDRQTD